MHTRGKTGAVAADLKAQLRAAVLRSRRAVPGPVRAAEAQALARHLREVVHADDTVCAYVPIGSEPGSADLVDLLHLLCGRLLLPVAHMDAAGEPLPLLWAEYIPGRLTAGRFGLLEPSPMAATEPWLPPSAVAEAEIVLVPALAVDRSGVRLGRGGGYYDRSLTLCRPACKLVAVIRDSEFIDSVPSAPHDVRMSHALTPALGLIALTDTV